MLSTDLADYDVNEDATRQELRTFVCAQCHVEYNCNPGIDPKTGALMVQESRVGDNGTTRTNYKVTDEAREVSVGYLALTRDAATADAAEARRRRSARSSIWAWCRYSAPMRATGSSKSRCCRTRSSTARKRSAEKGLSR